MTGAIQSLRERWPRRLVTIPAVLVFTAIIAGGLPLWLLVAVLRDLAMARGLPATRLLLFGFVWGLAQTFGLLALFLAWIVSGGGLHRGLLLSLTYAIQRVWVRSLYGAMCGLHGLRVELEAPEALGAAPLGPAIVWMQHTSLADTLLPTVHLTARRGLRLRWVLKKELLVDPCLDVAGHRLPNAFVGRDGAETATAVARVVALTEGLGPNDGVIIYPEGTRFSPSRRTRALARIAAKDPGLAARAEGLRTVLPPRSGGPLALLEAAPEADVIVIAHVGLEGLTTLREVLAGGLIGRTVRLRAWRFRASEVPRDKAAARAWLWTRWEALDAWVVSARGGTP